MTLSCIFSRRFFCCFSTSLMASVISLLKLSCVVWLILPVWRRLSRACFFFLAISYSSFSLLKEYFHEIKFWAPCVWWVFLGDNVC